MSATSSTRAPAGAQSITRAMGVLRLLSTSMPTGLSTVEVASGSKLTRPTAHRILSTLTAEGFVDKNALTGKWLLGPELYVMGAIAAERYDITSIAADQVASLANQTGESAFLSARRGNESVCLSRVDGSFPIRSFVLYEGVRFPLGVASAGIAMLSFETDTFIDEYLSRDKIIDPNGMTHSAAEIRERITETRELGFSVNPGLVVEGSWGMAAAIFSPTGSADWALSLTGVDTRFGRDRRPLLGRLLLEHAHEITQRLRSGRLN